MATDVRADAGFKLTVQLPVYDNVGHASHLALTVPAARQRGAVTCAFNGDRQAVASIVRWVVSTLLQ